MKLSLEIEPLTAIAWSIAIGALAVIGLIRYRRHGFKLTKVKITDPFELIEIELEPTYEEAQIAYKAWVELVTRKAALPFDPDHDVIVEMYDSWYALFGIMRDLTKDIPPEAFRSRQSARNLVKLLVGSLNKGLRPHLTQWQARFRHWYKDELERQSGKGLSPQEIQKKFPQYDELVTDLKDVNKKLVEYAKQVRNIALGYIETQ